MPSPGTANNPSGTNNFQGFGTEPAYGESLRQRTLQRAAPIPTPGAVNAPRRDQKKAVKGQATEAPPQAPPSLSPQMDARQAWAGVALIPELSPLARNLIQQLGSRG